MATDQHDPAQGRYAVSQLPAHRPFEITFTPDADLRAEIATQLGAEKLRKLRFEGAIAPDGPKGFVLTGVLGATVVQACVVTLEPVTTRIDTGLEMAFQPDPDLPPPGSETELSDEDTEAPAPLSDVIDVADAITEALALALPDYPKAPSAELGEAVFAEPGTAPLTEEAAKPFAGLAALRAQMSAPPETSDE